MSVLAPFSSVTLGWPLTRLQLSLATTEMFTTPCTTGFTAQLLFFTSSALCVAVVVPIEGATPSTRVV